MLALQFLNLKRSVQNSAVFSKVRFRNSTLDDNLLKENYEKITRVLAKRQFCKNFR
jgi:hypothetical protein